MILTDYDPGSHNSRLLDKPFPDPFRGVDANPVSTLEWSVYTNPGYMFNWWR